MTQKSADIIYVSALPAFRYSSLISYCSMLLPAAANIVTLIKTAAMFRTKYCFTSLPHVKSERKRNVCVTDRQTDRLQLHQLNFKCL